jgi:hypothetical protein
MKLPRVRRGALAAEVRDAYATGETTMAHAHVRSLVGLRPTFLLVLVSGAVRAGEDEYEVGGPLAGLKLPLLPTEAGEIPGYPGTTAPDATEPGADPRRFSPQGQAPQLELYPGAVENYRAYMFKYLPIRSFFDRQSQLARWTAPGIPGTAGTRPEEYAAPVYWVPRHDPPVDTGRRRAAAEVLRCGAGATVARLDLGELDVGLYAIRVVGAVDTKSLRPFRRPLFLEARIDDGPAGETSRHRLRLGYCDEFYSVAEVYFHAPAKRGYRASLEIGSGSEVELLAREILLDDVLAGTALRPIKTRTTLHLSPAPCYHRIHGTSEIHP